MGGSLENEEVVVRDIEGIGKANDHPYQIVERARMGSVRVFVGLSIVLTTPLRSDEAI